MSALREAVEDAVREAVKAHGVSGVSVVGVVRQFLGKGASERSLYRWARVALTSGAAMAAVPTPVTLALEAPASADAASPSVSPASVPARGIAVLDTLSECIRAAEQVMAHARKDDGSVRNAKLLIAASEHLRRNLETAVKLRESLRQDRDLDLFLDEVIREIEKESPAVAKRLFQRLNDILLVRGPERAGR